MALQVEEVFPGHVPHFLDLELPQPRSAGLEPGQVVERRAMVDLGPRVPERPVGGAILVRLSRSIHHAPAYTRRLTLGNRERRVGAGPRARPRAPSGGHWGLPLQTCNRPMLPA